MTASVFRACPFMIATITQALQRGDVAAALSAAQAYAISDAQNPQAHHWLGICLQRSGDIAGARVAIDQAINLAPDRADFQISRAALALGQKDYVAAEQGMKDAVNLDPNQLQAYVTLAHMALARGENDEAVKHLKFAQRLNPDHPQVLLLEGHIAQYSGQPDLALKCFTTATEMEPKNPLAQVSLGMAYGARGMWPFAEQALKNAIALESGNPGVMRGLVRSQMAQEKWPEAIDTLGQWLINKPADHSVRMMRAQVRAELGLTEEALEDLLMVNSANPASPQVLSPLVNILTSNGRPAEALEHIEAALKTVTDNETLWSMRVSMTANDLMATLGVLQRWLDAMPESAHAHESLAQVRETTGEFDAAEASADKALSLRQNLPHAQFIKLRAEIRKDPKKALARLETLQGAATNADSERMVFAWRGLTYDKLQQYDKASESFREMAKRMLDQARLPLVSPAMPNDSADIKGTLLWSPAGTRLQVVLQALSEPLQSRLLLDRNLLTARRDGFGRVRGMPGTAQAGTAESWQNGIRQAGLDPETVVDWIPHFDAYTASALKGVRTVAVICDPRDALINWSVYGSAQAFMFYPDESLSAEWLALTCEAFADHLEKNPESVSVVKIDGLPTQAASVALALQAALGLDAVPDANMLAQPMLGRTGFDTQFPSGHWRHYRDYFKKAFDRLTPVAVRLGYPES
ncbi:MAG: tetratricopeptide repeat protein [Arenimonas sp.]